MKILICIISVFFLMTSFGNADVETILKEIKNNKDLVQGFKRVKDVNGKFQNWRPNHPAILKSDKDTRKHVLKIVKKSDNFPVRLGEQSLRFEVRNGDGLGMG